MLDRLLLAAALAVGMAGAAGAQTCGTYTEVAERLAETRGQTRFSVVLWGEQKEYHIFLNRKEKTWTLVHVTDAVACEIDAGMGWGKPR